MLVGIDEQNAKRALVQQPQIPGYGTPQAPQTGYGGQQAQTGYGGQQSQTGFNGQQAQTGFNGQQKQGYPPGGQQGMQQGQQSQSPQIYQNGAPQRPGTAMASPTGQYPANYNTQPGIPGTVQQQQQAYQSSPTGYPNGSQVPNSPASPFSLAGQTPSAAPTIAGSTDRGIRPQSPANGMGTSSFGWSQQANLAPPPSAHLAPPPPAHFAQSRQSTYAPAPYSPHSQSSFNSPTAYSHPPQHQQSSFNSAPSPYGFGGGLAPPPPAVTSRGMGASLDTKSAADKVKPVMDW